MPLITPDPSYELRAKNFWGAVVRAFHRYAAWLVSISWKRFIVLSILLLIFAGILQSLPPFTWRTTETVVDHGERPAKSKASAKSGEPIVKVERSKDDEAVNITIGGKKIVVSKKNGVTEVDASDASRTPSAEASASQPSAASASSSAGSAAAQAGSAGASAQATAKEGVTISLPPGADSDEVREAVKEAQANIAEAIRDARKAAEDNGNSYSSPKRVRQTTTSLGEALPEMAFLWILGSALIKATYKGQLRAEAKAAVATETAEAETLKRQVVEARMAAMQAQVEPHFLFNTLASIDHLIETDPPRASKMQKNLIALLRASMPTMREASSSGLRDLGSELAVIHPYLEILKVRMDERLDAHVDVPDGLKSAAFPPMMLQSLVENAIKHGLEPKAEGGKLQVKAEIVHGRLVVSVADTGMGFGRAATAGTGVGLNNIRERLKLLFGDQGKLLVTANEPSGTVVSITVPYRSLDQQA